MGDRMDRAGDHGDCDDVPMDLTAVIPRCSHGNIILGCSEKGCPEELAYVEAANAAYSEWYQSTLPSAVWPRDNNEQESL